MARCTSPRSIETCGLTIRRLDQRPNDRRWEDTVAKQFGVLKRATSGAGGRSDSALISFVDSQLKSQPALSLSLFSLLK
jgi:hypothetical protein